MLGKYDEQIPCKKGSMNLLRKKVEPENRKSEAMQLTDIFTEGFTNKENVRSVVTELILFHKQKDCSRDWVIQAMLFESLLREANQLYAKAEYLNRCDLIDHSVPSHILKRSIILQNRCMQDKFIQNGEAIVQLTEYILHPNSKRLSDMRKLLEECEHGSHVHRK